MSGFIKLHRSIFDDTQPFSDATVSEREAFIWMICSACWKDENKRIGNQIIALERGQFSFSIRFMAGKFGWSVKRVRSFMKFLEKDGKIKIGHEKGSSRGTGQTVVTICNYSKFQDEETKGARKGHDNGHEEGTKRARKGHKDKEGKEYKEDKEDNNIGTLSDLDDPETEPEKIDWLDQKKNYAYEGQTIRLNRADYTLWFDRFDRLKLRDELNSLDDYYTREGVTDWFIRCSTELAKRQKASNLRPHGKYIPKGGWVDKFDGVREADGTEVFF